MTLNVFVHCMWCPLAGACHLVHSPRWNGTRPQVQGRADLITPISVTCAMSAPGMRCHDANHAMVSVADFKRGLPRAAVAGGAIKC